MRFIQIKYMPIELLQLKSLSLMSLFVVLLHFGDLSCKQSEDYHNLLMQLISSSRNIMSQPGLVCQENKIKLQVDKN